MNSRRDFRAGRNTLFDGIEEGGLRASSSYASHEIAEHDNERAIDGLQDRVSILKRVPVLLCCMPPRWITMKAANPLPILTGDIHEEVESQNRSLDRMGNEMDASRGVLSGTVDRFKRVFETKSSRNMITLVASFVVLFLLIYYLTK